MISRRNFVQNLSLGAGVLLLPSFSFANKKALNRKVIILDAIASSDIEKYFSKTFSVLTKFHTTSIRNLVTHADVHSHQACLTEITETYDDRFDVHLLSKIEAYHNTIVIEGFDVAHYNYQTYIERLQKCDALLAVFLEEELKSTSTHVLLMTSMGRNTFHNEITNENGAGGTDHHTDEARNCFALEVSSQPALVFNNMLETNTKELYQFFTQANQLSS